MILGCRLITLAPKPRGDEFDGSRIDVGALVEARGDASNTLIS